MPGHLYLAQGDITQLSADAIAYSASTHLGGDGDLYSSFSANVPGFAEWFAELRRGQTEQPDIGQTYWLRLGERKPHGLVVVIATGRRDRVADRPGLAVRGAVATAARELRAAGRAGRLLIALPAFRLGKGGDNRKRLESAIAQVRAARAEMELHDGIDVAFLAYTPALYRIFLEARRIVAGDAFPTGVPTLEAALADKTCVLFVGAGLSANAGLPGWNELIGRLGGDLGIAPHPSIDHLDLAQWYRERFGGSRLAAELKATFSGSGLPTLAHYLLMGLPARHVLTTNYDHLLERCLVALKRHPLPVVSQQDVARTGEAGVFVVKLHGDAEHPDDIVLSRDDYDTFFERRPAMALLLEGLLLNQTFFFVGYSLRDPNFRHLFGRIARMLRDARRPAFATSFEARGGTAEYLRQQWGKQGLQLVPVEGDTAEEQVAAFHRFLDALSERVTMRSPPLALAADVAVPPGLAGLRSALESAGEEAQRLCEAGEGDVRFLGEVLDFLAAHGWRPTRPATLCSLYESLASRAFLEDRRRLLVAGLAVAEALADANRLRGRLAELS